MAVNILSTSALDQGLTDRANREVRLDVIPFIDVRNLVGIQPGLLEEIVELCALPVTAVFTSANAVKAISGIAEACQPQWTVYCIGNATRNEVTKAFTQSDIEAVADNSAELAEIIKEHGVQEIVFFCGDKRLETLPATLAEDDILVYEHIVYETKETPVALEQPYSGILFFSPSAVQSFFSVNTPGKNTVLFSIGNTTAEAIRNYSDNKIIVCDKPSKDEVVATAIRYFNQQGQ